jgi:hypothetical protein
VNPFIKKVFQITVLNREIPCSNGRKETVSNQRDI